MKDPDIVPATSTHDGLVINPLGDEVIAHPASPAAKFEPEILTTVLARPEFTDSTIVGVNMKGADLEVPLGFEVTVTVETPGTAAPTPTTVNEPVTTPPVIEHVCADTISGEAVIVQVVSVGVKPVPATETMVPVGPKLGVRVNADGDFVKAADTDPRELGKITE